MPVTKGRFTSLLTGDFRSFSLNPSTLSDDKSREYGSADIASISDPPISDGRGGERTISFVLRLDSDVGYRDRRAGGQESPGHVSDEIRWYRQFLYSEARTAFGDEASQVETILFTLGNFYQGVRCKMVNCGLSIIQQREDGSPTRADLAITLREQPTTNVDRRTIYDPSVHKGF